ncbi:MAG TPA: hypothetical protein P5079_09160, partial [Elusimicrobiota bacterium]|nr:hypothetical protein [Elusimicrobiota bacterium]
YYLSSVSPRDLSMPVGKDVEAPPDPSYIILPKKELRVDANTIEPFHVFLEMPKQEEYRGKRYVFLLQVELPGETAILNQIARIYVNTEK